MKKIVYIVLLVVYSCAAYRAQIPTQPLKNFIEVSGTSETEIVPDEIYITITLLERMEGKEKITIEKQEAELKKHIKELGLDVNNLVLNTANADFGKVRRNNKDVLINKSYILKVGGTDILAKIYERLDKMNALDAYISRYTHSKILEYQKENRIKAIKAAKEKVDYLLAALGEKAGEPVQIVETDNYVQDEPPGMFRQRAYTMNVVQSYETDQAQGEEMSFKKIKIRSSFLVKYEILNN